jgi:N-acetylmuramoyl-L-alanine amidase
VATTRSRTRGAAPASTTGYLTLLALFCLYATSSVVEAKQPLRGAVDRPGHKQAVTVNYASVTATPNVTRLKLGLSAPRVRVPKVATLPSPYRLIADFRGTYFRLARGVGKTGHGLISAFRYGLITPGVSRLIVDVKGPFSVRAMRILTTANGHSEIIFEIVAVPADRFVRQGRAPTDPVKAALRKGKFDHIRHKGRRQPVIVIDPGHGGPDPGAIGSSNTYEKDIALAVGRRLWALLRSGNRYRVLMTRTRDIFVSLDQRVEISHKVGADLFVSLHADATVQGAAIVRGASIYTLSQRASNAEAHRLAQKENAADVLAGLAVARLGPGHDVENILIDLLNRETRVFSHRVQDAIIRTFRSKIVLSGDPRRSAAFKVLKQTGVPSVLVELGYISNKRDEHEMNTSAWQTKVADAIARAVGAYFDTTRSIVR